jgi:uncharacterized protein (UPF0332 family)
VRPGRQDYIGYRLSRARSALRSAEGLLELGELPDVVNRLYYACFYAVTALLFSEGITASKHSGVISMFGKHWTQPGRFPRQMGRFIHEMFQRRLEGDYGDQASFDRAEVEAWLAETRSFVERIASYLEEGGKA